MCHRKAYVLLENDWDSTEIVGVFSSRKKADYASKLFPGSCVDEFELNEFERPRKPRSEPKSKTEKLLDQMARKHLKLLCDDERRNRLLLSLLAGGGKIKIAKPNGEL